MIQKLEHQLMQTKILYEALLSIDRLYPQGKNAILDFLLNCGITLTESEIGYIYFYNEVTQKLTNYAWSKEVLPICHVVNPQTEYALETTGIWGEAIRQRKPMIINDYTASNPLKRGLPQGHVAMKNHMNVPIFSGDDIVALIGVSNKPVDYDDYDVSMLQVLMTHGYSKIMQYEATQVYIEQQKRDIEALKTMRDALEIASTIDPLTQLINRRAMMEKLSDENARYLRHGTPFSVIMADIDFFKRVNDECGHDCGDYILEKIAQCMKSVLREEDVISRWGGEEFLILLPETLLEGAVHLAKRICEVVSASIFQYNHKEIYVTMTFGVAEHNHARSVDKTIIFADQALYRGKNEGRNQVHV